MISGQRIQYVRNSGISGNTSGQMLARFDTDVTPYAPNVVTILAGRNDVGKGNDLATLQANLPQLVAKTRAIGAIPVLATIPQTDATTPVNANQTIRQMNGWIRRYAAAQGLICLDFASVLVDPATGGYLAQYKSDGIHPNAAGMQALANYANGLLPPLLPVHSPTLCRDATDDNNAIYNGVFSGCSGTALPTPFADQAGTPSGSALSYTTDANVPGQLLTITSTATTGLRQIAANSNIGQTTMPAVAAGATSFSLTGINPSSRAVLFIGSGSTFEVVKVSAVSGSGPYSVTLARGLAFAHTAGEQVIVNGLPGDKMVFSGVVTTDGGVTFRAGVNATGAGSGVRAASDLTRPMTRAAFHQEFIIPASTTALLAYIQVSAGTGVVSVGQLGLYNVTRLGLTF
jgi:lysophospholipase L1-like esterase